MTKIVYLPAFFMELLFSHVSVNHTLAQNSCDNFLSVKVKSDISYNTANCEMIPLAEMMPSFNCIEMAAAFGGFGALVENRYITNWCCVFYGGQVKTSNTKLLDKYYRKTTYLHTPCL